MFTSNSSLVQSSVSAAGISDHDLVVTDTQIKPFYAKQQPRKCHQYSKANWDSLKAALITTATEVTSKYEENANVDELWSTFHSKLLKAIDEFIPQKSKRMTASQPWIDSKLRRLLRRKVKLYQRAKASKNWDEYHQFQKEIKKEMRQAEWQHIENKITEGFESNNTKPFWSYVKSKRQDNIGVAPLDEDGTLHSESADKARILLKQFKSVFTPQDDSDQEMPHVDSNNIKSTLSSIAITETGVAKLLRGVNPSKASGPDNIPNRVLKECADQIAPSLCCIFQRSLDTGILPQDWRSANISSVFKKGDRHQAENYRPISLTSVISKLLEHIVCKNMLDHLEKNKILTDLNHGFRSGYSCETQLLVTSHDLIKSLNAGKQVDIGILDFSKAFDTVPHTKLLHKLDQYGIRGYLHEWLSCFLTQRTMQVVLEGATSEEAPVVSGVPQGTVLGPLLFLCHINDLPKRVKSQVRLFADDCLIYRPINSAKDHDILQEDFTALEGWAEDSGMRFNAKKCYILSVKNKSDYSYTLNGTVLKSVKDNPYLGVQFSNDLSWSPHIEKTAKKANSIIGFLRRNLRNCSEPSRRKAYLALVRSVLEYGSIVWDPHLQKDIDVLERVQRKGVRFVTGDYRSRTPGCVTNMLVNQKLDTLQERRRQLRLTFLYKIAAGKFPAIPADSFLTRQRPKRIIRAKQFSGFETANIIENQTRNNTKCFQVDISAKDTKQYRNSFFIKTVIDWNHLNEETASAETVEEFRSNLAVHL